MRQGQGEGSKGQAMPEAEIEEWMEDERNVRLDERVSPSTVEAKASADEEGKMFMSLSHTRTS